MVLRNDLLARWRFEEKEGYTTIDDVSGIRDPVKLIGAFKAAETFASDEDDGYWVCFEVVNFGRIPEGMVPLTVPAQKYAVLQFRGHASEIYGVYQHLHQWMNENGYKSLPEKWTLEIYSKWTETEDIVELCCPVMER